MGIISEDLDLLPLGTRHPPEMCVCLCGGGCGGVVCLQIGGVGKCRFRCT